MSEFSPAPGSLTIHGYAREAKKAWTSDSEKNVQASDATFGLMGAIGRFIEVSRIPDSATKSQLLRRELGDALCYITILSEIHELGGLYEVAVSNLVRIAGGHPYTTEDK